MSGQLFLATVLCKDYPDSQEKNSEFYLWYENWALKETFSPLQYGPDADW